MRLKCYIITMLAWLITANVAIANNDKCTDIQNIAKTETINGQSKIPKVSLVVATKKKVYFHTAPDESCRQDDKFIIAGDILYAYKLHAGFTYVNYITSSGDEVKGWVNSSELNKFSPSESKLDKKLNITDFIIVSQNSWFGLGSSFSNDKYLQKEKETSSEYVGDFPNDSGGLDEFYAHSYLDFSLIVSNVNYDKRLWTIDDDYIISDITLTTSKYQTRRGIKVGDKKEDVLKAYDGIAPDNSNNEISYALGSMSLNFKLSNDIVTSIEMSLIPE